MQRHPDGDADDVLFLGADTSTYTRECIWQSTQTTRQSTVDSWIKFQMQSVHGSGLLNQLHYMGCLSFDSSPYSLITCQVETCTNRQQPTGTRVSHDAAEG